METLNACPICNGQNLEPFIKCIDFTVSKETFQIVQCTNCDFKFTNPRPLQGEIGKYYESEDYISHSNSKKGLFNLVYQTIRNITLKGKVKLINSFNSETKKLLDIGCGTGEFLNTASSSGWTVEGLEPGESARSYGIKTYGILVNDLSHLENLPAATFDVITMWHVLEHVPNLHETLQQIKKILKPKGTLVVAVPNCEAFEEGKYSNVWAAYDVPRHLNHFTVKTATNLFKINNLEVFGKKSMPFDPFYISMLSEKYKGAGIMGMGVNGLVNGIQSNFAASKDISKASSIIYLIKKS
jgi:2-polyprenyl-3-methyl-5-hydroxy-6-metoxy-1,4-benzoquinol methylase